MGIRLMQISKITSPWNKMTEIMDRFIFPLAVICFLLGDLAVCILGYVEFLLLPLFLIAIVIFIIGAVLKKYQLLLITALLLGYCWCGIDAANLDNFHYGNGRAVEITGTVKEVVTTREDYLTDISSVGELGDFKNYIVKGTTTDGWHGKVMVSAVDYDLQVGDKIHLVGSFNDQADLQNWLLNNDMDYYRYQGVAGYVEAISGELQVLELANPNFFQRLVDNTKEKLYLQMEDLPEKQQQLLKGLAFGDKSTMTGHDRSVVAQTGVAHVFAVSGLHLAFVLAFVLGVFKLIGKVCTVPKWLKLLLVVALTTFYAAICGFTYSVIRAMVMGFAATMTIIYYENYDSKLSILYGALVCVLIQPYAFCDIGFQLSFVATLALICTYGIWKSLVKFGVVATLLSAQMAVTPIVVYSFSILSFTGLIVSPIVSSLSGLVVCFSFLAVLFSFVNFSSIFLYIAGMVAEIIYKLCEIAASLPLSFLAIVKPHILLVVICYLLMIAGYYILHKWRQDKLSEVANGK